MCVFIDLKMETTAKLVVPQEYSEMQVTMESSLAVLLPSFHGYGICSLGLLNGFIQITNSFLQKYCEVTKQE